MDEPPTDIVTELPPEVAIANCRAYFRQAIANPESVPPWAEWWATNAELVERVFSMIEFVRLKHRGLLGAKQHLQMIGEWPKDLTIPPTSETKPDPLPC